MEQIKPSKCHTNNNSIIGIDNVHTGYSHTWNGRLMQVEDPDLMATVYHLINAEVIDSDVDGLSDDLESLYGTNPNDSDTNGNGINDKKTQKRSQIIEVNGCLSIFCRPWVVVVCAIFWRSNGVDDGFNPGFHVNNVALILLALSPVFLDWGIPLSAVAAIIVSTGTVHTFLNYIPSALLGAPDGDTALSLLPAYRMLLSGSIRGVASTLHVALLVCSFRSH